MSDLLQSEQSCPKSILTRGWEIVRLLNDSVPTMPSREARQLLAEYAGFMHLPISLGEDKAVRQLHAAILSVAVKMAQAYPDFRFVPFLNLWGLQHLRPEDGEAKMDETGRRFPSLVERLAKSYAYSLLFHPEEHLEPDLESTLLPFLQQKGFSSVGSMLATRTFTTDVRGRNMTFVSLITPDGTELSCEVHVLTRYQSLRYNEIPGRLFDVLPRCTDKGARIEAAILSNLQVQDMFQTAIGYVEYLDLNHRHVHIYDSFSRHLVAFMDNLNPLMFSCMKEGTYVEFVPIIPRESRFKSAIVTHIIPAEEGPKTFGFRKVVVTNVDTEKNFCSWKLLPDEDGKVNPIVESETTEPSYTEGYISSQLFIDKPLPAVGSTLSLIVYLKRGKDALKRPHVVAFF